MKKSTDSMEKEKKFRIDYAIELCGSMEIEAFDEEDAREQFCVDSIHDFDDLNIAACTEITNVTEVKEKKRKKK